MELDGWPLCHKLAYAGQMVAIDGHSVSPMNACFTASSVKEAQLKIKHIPPTKLQFNNYTQPPDSEY